MILTLAACAGPAPRSVATPTPTPAATPTVPTPADARYWLEHGRARLDRGDYAGAKAYLTRALEIDPAEDQALFWLARAWVENPNRTKADATEARSTIRAFLAEHPDDPKALGTAATIDALAREYRLMLRDARRALTLLGGTPEELRWLYILEVTLNDMDLHNNIEISAKLSDLAGTLDRPGLEAVNEPLYTLPYSLDKNNSFALGRRGRARMRLGRYHAAIDDLSRALAIAPDSAFNNLAMAQTIRHFYEPPAGAALAYLARTLAVEPGNIDALVLRSAIHLDLGQLDKAADDLRLAHKLAPEDPVVKKALADFQAANNGKPLTFAK